MTPLDELSQQLGIWHSYWENGQEYVASPGIKKALCQALGYPADTPTEARQSLAKWRMDQFADFVPPVVVVREWEVASLALEIVIPVEAQTQTLSWFLTREDQTTDGGTQNLADLPVLDSCIVKDKTYLKKRLSLSLSVPLGYHTLTFLLDGKKPTSNTMTNLIVTPNTCYMPAGMQRGNRVWGLPIQLYAVSSQHNWGMGDMTDLRYLADVAETLKASFIGVNPLNALFPDSPQDASPYFATARTFLNPLYIDTDAIPEAATSPAYADYQKSARFIELLTAAKQSPTVEYDYVAEMKYTALGILYDTFKNLHLTSDWQATTPRGQAFLDFCQGQDDDLTLFATHQALRSYFAARGQSRCWADWPKGYRTPTSSAVRAFQKTYADSIWFAKYQQFIAVEQFEAVRAAYDRPSLPVGLYTDLPVGVGLGSAEVWMHQNIFLPGVSVGAPPDFMNKKGQDWSLAAFNPIRLKKTRYAFFIRLLKRIMRPSGALRIDHVFSLMRLFLRVKGGGAYLSYPFRDLLGLVALESVRNRTIVVGEDLGTVPPGFMEEMARAGTLSFRLMQYQKRDGKLMPPGAYEHRCLITPGTHDMPTYPAFWQGLDLDLKKRLKTMSPKQYKAEQNARPEERRQFVDAFIAEGLLPDQDRTAWLSSDLPDWFIPNTYAFLARSPSLMLVARLEDMVGQIEQVNVPGTYLNYPNWRYKLPVLLENITSDDRIMTIAERINRERPLIPENMNG